MTSWLLEHLYLAPIVPAAAALLCIMLSVVVPNNNLKVILWIVPAALLAAVHVLALSITRMPLVNFVLITPQSPLLIALALRISWKRWKSPEYIPPSLWGAVLIILVGNLWTAMWMVALGG